MNPKKKLLVASGTLALTLVLALVAVPSLFEEQVVTRARAELDRSVAAHVDWSGIGLSLLRDFPNLTLTVDDLTAVGRPPFDGDTLASVAALRFELDLGSVWRAWREQGPVEVRSIRVDRPTVRLLVLDDGTPNWDLLAGADSADPTDESDAAGGPEDMEEGGRASSIGVELRSLEVTDGTVSFENRLTGVLAAAEGLTYDLEGNFGQQRLVARTEAHADRATVRFAGVPWLDGVAVDFRADVDADLAEGRFVFQDNELRLNDLAVAFSGDATRLDDGVELAVAFSAPATDFGQALSLVPALYARDFATLETSGTFTFEGTVRGRLGQGALPAFALNASVADGRFRYPDLPLPARDIALDLAIDNPYGPVDSTVVRVSRFHVVVGDQPVDADLTLRTPVSDPDVDASVRGTVDLADVGRTVKLERVQELTGIVSADASIRARLSDLDAQRYEQVTARGSVSARDLAVRAEGLRQPVTVREATLALTPRRADLTSFDAVLGSSDVRGRGWIDNLLGAVLRGEPLQGSATFDSRYVALDEWRSEDPELEVIPVPAMLDFTLAGTIQRLTLGDLEMTGATGRGRVANQRLTMEDVGLRTLGGRMGFNGFYDTSDPARPTFDVALTVDSMDVAQASEAFLTVRTLAPVARYARGTFSTQLDLSGVLNGDLTPVFDALDGDGLLLTSRIAIEDFPLLQQLASTLTLPRLSNPTFEALRSSVEIRGGRMHVRPLQVGVAGFQMTVAGSNGIDQSLDYTLGLTIPRAALGDAADRFIQGLTARAGQAGLDLGTADSIRVGVGVGGTIRAPSLDVGVGEAVASARAMVERAAGAEIERRMDEARADMDAAAAAARARAQARADSVVAEAEERAEQIRAEAARLAAQVRAEGARGADEVLARATNPLARRAAEPVANRIRQEADRRAADIEREADERADALVAEARSRADQIMGIGAAPPPPGDTAAPDTVAPDSVPPDTVRSDAVRAAATGRGPQPAAMRRADTPRR